MSKLLVLRDGSALGRAIMKPGHHLYFKRITKSGRNTTWTGDPMQAMQTTRPEWEKLRAKWPRQLRGRLVRPPVTA